MIINDEEFGEIKIRKSKLARNPKFSVGVDGFLRLSLPYYTPDFAAARLVRQNRAEIRDALAKYRSKNTYRDGDFIGKTHTLVFRPKNEEFSAKIEAHQIIISGENLESAPAQAEIRKIVAKILRKQAKKYLPRRVEFFAQRFGFHFEKLRFSHTSSRWGSCSSTGTISLNIALMNLPIHLIDYVIIHELCHTRQMNHSEKFWAEVEKCDPNFREHVREMRNFSPYI